MNFFSKTKKPPSDTRPKVVFLSLPPKQPPQYIDQQNHHQSRAECGEESNDRSDDAECAENERENQAEEAEQKPDRQK